MEDSAELGQSAPQQQATTTKKKGGLLSKVEKWFSGGEDKGKSPEPYVIQREPPQPAYLAPEQSAPRDKWGARGPEVQSPLEQKAEEGKAASTVQGEFTTRTDWGAAVSQGAGLPGSVNWSSEQAAVQNATRQQTIQQRQEVWNPPPQYQREPSSRQEQPQVQVAPTPQTRVEATPSAAQVRHQQWIEQARQTPEAQARAAKKVGEAQTTTAEQPQPQELHHQVPSVVTPPMHTPPPPVPQEAGKVAD